MAFRDFSTEAERLGAGTPVKEALWVRAYEKARKLALLYAVSETRDTTSISGDAALWGCQVVRHLTLRMEYLADRWIGEGVFGTASQRVYRLIDDAGKDGMSGTELCRSTQNLKPRERSEILDNLQSAGRIFHRKDTGNGAGRKPNTYISARLIQ